MAQLIETPHVDTLVTGYALGLLSEEELVSVTDHIKSCNECRRAWFSEQSLARAAKETLMRASAPDKDRIQHLMPVPPATPRPRWRVLPLAPGLAAAAVMFLVLFSAIALFSVQRPGTWTFSAPTTGTAEIVLTNTPTQTATFEFTATADLDESATVSSLTIPAATGVQTLVPAPSSAPVPAASLIN